MYWRDIGDVMDPVEAYTTALEARRGSCKSDQDLLRLAELYDDVGKFFDSSARFEAAIDICTKALQYAAPPGRPVLGTRTRSRSGTVTIATLAHGIKRRFRDWYGRCQVSCE